MVHNGAFLLVDAINPDVSIVPEVYHDIMKGIYSKTSQYEKYITGKLDHDAAIWFATHAKYDPNETKIDVREKSFEPNGKTMFVTAFLMIWCVVSLSGVSSFLYYRF